MGLFGPPKEFRERTFTMPCSPAEAIEVIAGATDTEGEQPFGAALSAYLNAEEPGKAPVAEAIYITEFDVDSGFTLLAGNRSRTYWGMRLALTGDNQTMGTFGVTQYNENRWWGNVLSMVFALQSAVRATGGRTGRWPL